MSYDTLVDSNGIEQPYIDSSRVIIPEYLQEYNLVQQLKLRKMIKAKTIKHLDRRFDEPSLDDSLLKICSGARALGVYIANCYHDPHYRIRSRLFVGDDSQKFLEHVIKLSVLCSEYVGLFGRLENPMLEETGLFTRDTRGVYNLILYIIPLEK